MGRQDSETETLIPIIGGDFDDVQFFAGNKESDVAATLQTTCDDYSRADSFNVVAFHHNAQAAQLPTASRDTSVSDSLTCSQQAAVAVALRGREGGATAELGDEVGGCLRASSGGGDKPYVLTTTQVRRLTPRECERLQGFPDDYTLVPIGKKLAADGPRYKALGNSMAVPVMAWIGARIHRALITTAG